MTQVLLSKEMERVAEFMLAIGGGNETFTDMGLTEEEVSLCVKIDRQIQGIFVRHKLNTGLVMVILGGMVKQLAMQMDDSVVLTMRDPNDFN